MTDSDRKFLLLVAEDLDKVDVVYTAARLREIANRPDAAVAIADEMASSISNIVKAAQ